MPKFLAAAVAAVCLVALGLPLPADAATQRVAAKKAPAKPKVTTTTAAPTVAPDGSFILVDNDTGNVLAQQNDRTALPPASITKLLTALVVEAHIRPDTNITVATSDPQSKPPLKIGVTQGSTWPVGDLMRGLLMVSANDAAIALAEAVSGTEDNFAATRADAAQQLGLADAPVLLDPAGLDDTESSNDGGDRISARDMAIIARAALAQPEIKSIVSTQRYDFTGPDHSAHHFLNHNGMLKTYPGAIGMKTGYTVKAHHTLVAAATRNGRTMVAIIMKADDPNAIASSLMDQGFNTPVASEVPLDHLGATSLRTDYVNDKSAPAPAVRHHGDSTWTTPLAYGGGVLALLIVCYRYRRAFAEAYIRNQEPLNDHSIVIPDSFRDSDQRQPVDASRSRD